MAQETQARTTKAPRTLRLAFSVVGMGGSDGGRARGTPPRRVEPPPNPPRQGPGSLSSPQSFLLFISLWKCREMQGTFNFALFSCS